MNRARPAPTVIDLGRGDIDVIAIRHRPWHIEFTAGDGGALDDDYPVVVWSQVTAEIRDDMEHTSTVRASTTAASGLVTLTANLSTPGVLLLTADDTGPLIDTGAYWVEIHALFDGVAGTVAGRFTVEEAR